MAVNFNLQNTVSYTHNTQKDKCALLSQLEELNKKKQELLLQEQSIQKALKEVEEQATQIKAQLTQFKTPAEEETRVPDVEKKALEVEELIKPYLLVDTTKIMKSEDRMGKWDHYTLSLITKEDEKIEVKKPPINERKYGSISQIVIDNGTSKTVLKTDSIYIQRLVHYFTTDFDVFRKSINAEQLDFHGSYSNKHIAFECQRFSYYLHHGKEDTYGWKERSIAKENYREAEHIPGGFYSLSGQTNNFGENGGFSRKDLSSHHYMCLTKDVFVSKFGENTIAFSSYKQILDAYFPDKFVKGHFYQE